MPNDNTTLAGDVVVAGRTGLGFDLRLAVARLGLATASPCSLVLAYGCGVLVPKQAKLLACFRPAK